MKSRRTTVLINKKFQFQSAVFSVALTVLLVNLFIIFRTLFFGDQVLGFSRTTTLVIASAELFLVASVWFGSLRLTHRIAGPVHVFLRETARLGNGDLTAQISLRKKDMFQDAAEQMNVSFAALRARIDSIKKISAQLSARDIEDEGVQKLLTDINDALSEIVTNKEE